MITSLTAEYLDKKHLKQRGRIVAVRDAINVTVPVLPGDWTLAVFACSLLSTCVSHSWSPHAAATMLSRSILLSQLL